MDHDGLMIDRNEQLDSERDYLRDRQPAPPGARPAGGYMINGNLVRSDKEIARRVAWLQAYKERVRAASEL